MGINVKDADGTSQYEFPFLEDYSGKLGLGQKLPLNSSLMIGAEGFPAQISGFGELLVGMQQAAISVRFGANMSTLNTKASIIESGAGTITYSENGYAQIDSTAGDTLIRSKQVVPYAVKHPLDFGITCGVTNTTGTVDIGPHDAEAGFFWTVNAATGEIDSFTIRNLAGDTTTTAANFTGKDLTGIDFRDIKLYIFRFGWLGVYPPTLWVIHDGRLVLIHREDTASGRTSPHVQHPALPVQIQAKSGAIARTSSWFGGQTGGNIDDTGYIPVVYGVDFTTAQGATAQPLNFRVKSTDADGNIVRIRAALNAFNGLVQSSTTGQSGIVKAELYAGPTISGESWGAVRADSLVEVDTTGTSTGGTLLARLDFSFDASNQGGTTVSLQSINPSRQGLIGFAGDEFSLRFTRWFGSGTWVGHFGLGWDEI